MNPNSQVLARRRCQSGSAKGEDRISELSGDLVSCILSRLPTKQAVRSCVLSKDWVRKWHFVHTFKFDDRWFSNVEGGSFIDFLESTLPQLKNIVNFNLFCQKKYDSSRIEACLQALLVAKVQCFEYENCSYEAIHLPPSLLNNDSVRDLNLRCCLRFRVPNQNCAPNLKRLILSEVWFLNDDSSSDTLVFTFPVLETFHVKLCQWGIEKKRIEIHAPKLTDFQSDNVHHCSSVTDRSFSIHGANLEMFAVSGGFLETFDLSTSTVVRADLAIVNSQYVKLSPCGIQARNLLAQLSTIRELKLHGASVEAIKVTKDETPLPVFCVLEKLEITLYVPVEGLFMLLHASPNLKLLRLETDAEYEFEEYNYDDVDVPTCILTQLESLEFDHFQRTDPEYALLKFIVTKGGAMMKFLICCYDEIDDEEVREEISVFHTEL